MIVHACAKAFATRDRPALLAIAESPGPDGQAAATLALYLQARSDNEWSGYDSAIDACVRDPASSPEVHICLLTSVIGRQRRTGVSSEMGRLLRRLGDLLPLTTDPMARYLVHRTRWEDAVLRGDIFRSQQLAEEGAAASLPDSDQWLQFTSLRLNSMIDNFDLHRARALLDGLHAHDADFRRAGYDLQLQEDLYDIAVGRPKLVLERCRKRTQGPDWLICWAAISARRFRLAEKSIATMESGTEPGPAIKGRWMRAVLATARQQYALLDELIESSEVRPQAPFYASYVACALEAALCRGRVEAAHQALAVLDPHALVPRYRLARTRLHLLEGDRPAALRCFAELCAAGPASMVHNLLREAHELDASTVAELRAGMRTVAAAKPADDAPPAPADEPGLVGEAPSMQAVRALIASCAPLALPVLISGATGTGKEVVARLLHRQGSARSGPFLALNCAGLMDSLAESELFGHVRGSFTGAVGDSTGLIAAAAGGTLFLDEINSLSLRLQGLLLRLLEAGEYRQVGGTTTLRARCRFVFACNVDLEQVCEDGGFRSDLRFRLERLIIRLPALRDRRQDIPLLCRHFLGEITGNRKLTIEPNRLAAWSERDWPGNVRELRNEIERLVLLGAASVDAPQPSAPSSTARKTPEPRNRPDQARIPGPAQARERRRAVLALFEHLAEVYPADVMAAVACAPNTAARDLEALAAVGLIRRQAHSGHPRFNPYVRVPGAGT